MTDLLDSLRAKAEKAANDSDPMVYVRPQTILSLIAVVEAARGAVSEMDVAWDDDPEGLCDNRHIEYREALKLVALADALDALSPTHSPEGTEE